MSAAALIDTNQLRTKATEVIGSIFAVRGIDTWEIGYRGPWESLRCLEQIEGAYYAPQYYLAMPFTRENALLTETVGKVEEASDEYCAFRSVICEPPVEYLNLYPPARLGQPEPMRHQREAFAWAMKTFHEGGSGFGIWLEMGCGKTRVAIDIMRAVVAGLDHHGRPARIDSISLVVTQKVCLGQWEDEIARGWPEAVPIILSGSIENRCDQIQDTIAARKRNPGDKEPIVFITNWESIHRMRGGLKLARLFDVLILDESSRIKAKDTQMSKQAVALAGMSTYRLCLSGTPMANHPGDFWAQYRVINRKLFDNSYWNYLKYYCRLGGITGYEFQEIRTERVTDLVQKLYSCAYRATKATVGDLPPKTRRVVELELTPEQRKCYNQVAKEMFLETELETGTWVTLQITSAMAKLLRLQQITAGILPFTLISYPNYVQDSLQGHQKWTPIGSVKTDWTVDYVRSTLQTDAVKIVIWARFTPEVQQIFDALTGPNGPLDDSEVAIIDGRTSALRREVYRREFNVRGGELKVLVCQIQAAAYGMDLPGADVLIYHSGSFSYTDRLQSEDRGHRLGRTRPYQIIDLCIRKTVDETVMEAIAKKRNLADLLIQAGTLPRAILGGK